VGNIKISAVWVDTTLLILALGLTLVVSSCKAGTSRITQGEVVSRTQELFDAVASGNKGPWQKYFADDVLYFDEKGRSMDKKALVADVEPLPKGYSGTIKVVNSKFHHEGNTVIHTFDADEMETVFGQELHARYHETDTWMSRNGQWQIVAGQVLRYYEDPAPGQVDERKLKDYVGAYELAPGDRGTVSVEQGKLYWTRGTRPAVELIPEACDIFFRKGIEGRRVFHYQNGKVDAMIDRRNNEDIVWKRVPEGQ
jgi:ketosteroid isomerase-like protein